MRKEMKKWSTRLCAMLVVFLVAFGSVPEAKAEENYTTASNLESRGIDLLFCIDHSGSTNENIDTINKAARSIAYLSENRDVRIGSVYFGESVMYDHELTAITESNVEEVLNILAHGEESNENTDISVGLKKCVEKFSKSDDSRKRVVIMFSDGANVGNDVRKKDEETLKAAAALKSVGAEIYCVYLEADKDSTLKSDTDLLKKIVNYGEDGPDPTNTKFFSLANGKISTLSDWFEKAFYSSQNNMKYDETLAMDSVGNYAFYVPEVCTTEIRIFLKNVPEDSTATFKQGENQIDDVTEVKDGTFRFYTIHNPSAGDWAINCTNGAGVVGSIAFYSDLQASVTIEADQNQKGQNARLHVSFANAKGEEKMLDTSVAVTGTVRVNGHDVLLDGDGILANEGTSYVSKDFTLDVFGSYTAEISVTYKTYINLEFTNDAALNVGNQPLEALEYNKKQKAEKTEINGEKYYVVSIPIEELFYDPEGSEIVVAEPAPEEILAEAEDAGAFARVEEGMLKIYSRQPGLVELTLHAQDTPGEGIPASEQQNTISVTMTSNDKLIGILIMVVKVVIGLVIFTALIFLALALKKKTDDNKKADDIGKNKEIVADAIKEYSKDVEKNNDLVQNRKLELEKLEKEIPMDDYEKLTQEMYNRCHVMPEEQRAVLGVKKYATREESFREKDNFQREKSEYAAKLQKYSTAYDTFITQKQILERAAQVSGAQIDDYIRDLEAAKNDAINAYNSYARQADTYQKAIESLTVAVDGIRTKNKEVMNQIEEKFRCDILIQFVPEGENETYTGHNPLQSTAKNGCVLLDNLNVLDGNTTQTIYDLSGVKSGILISPYKKDTAAGILLRSEKHFVLNGRKETNSAEILDSDLNRTAMITVEDVGTIKIELMTAD